MGGGLRFLCTFWQADQNIHIAVIRTHYINPISQYKSKEHACVQYAFIPHYYVIIKALYGASDLLALQLSNCNLY